MRFFLAPVLLFVMSLTSPLAAHAQDEEPADDAPADSVTLTFGWPEGLAARVTMDRFRERITPEGADTLTATATYRMTAEREGDGLLIGYEGFDADVVLGEEESGRSEELIQRLSAVMPSFSVSRSGEFRQLENAEQIGEVAEEVIAALFPDEAAVPEEVRSVIASMLSPEVLTASAAQQWNVLVGFWNGATLDVGAVYELETEAPVPIMPEERIAMVQEFSIAERVPCTEEGEEPDCVRLEIVTAPDEEAMAGFVQRFLARVAAGADLPAFEEMALEHSVSLVVEPETLIPHLLVTTRSFEGAARVEGSEEGESFSEVDQRVYTFAH